MSTIRKILEKKGGEVWSVTTKSTVYDALSLMAEKSIGAVLVIDDNTLKGVMSERDYARKIILEGKSSKDVLVGEIMSPRVIYVDTIRCSNSSA